MSFSIKGWPEGHPQLTKIDGYPFGHPTPQCSDPTSQECEGKRDGYSASFKALYDRYKRSAVQRGLVFEISKKDFWLLTSQPCFVCAAPPSHGKSSKYKNPYLYNGIDRVTSAEGYRLGNVVGCCWAHNRIKGDLTHQKFFEHCLAVVLSELSKTATGNNDIATLERLIDLFPNVRFLQEHHRYVWAELTRNPRALVLTPEWRYRAIVVGTAISRPAYIDCFSKAQPRGLAAREKRSRRKQRCTLRSDLTQQWARQHVV